MKHLSNCPACQQHNLQHSHFMAKDYLVSKEMFSVSLCKQCGLLFTNPRPEDDQMTSYYNSEDYISHVDQPKSCSERIYMGIRSLMLKRKVKLVKKHVAPHSKVLDIGCGTGGFAGKLHKMDYVSMGVEPEKKAAEIAGRKGIVVYERTDELLSGHENALHAITMWHVLEHITEPLQHLNLCHRLLLPGGIMMVAVPLHGCHDAAVYKQFWAAWDLPRHLLHFSPEVLVNVMQKAGFTLLHRRILPFDAYYISWLSARYKTNKSGPCAMLHAFYTGLVSNLLARCSHRPASSEVFVFRKNDRQTQ